MKNAIAPKNCDRNKSNDVKQVLFLSRLAAPSIVCRRLGAGEVTKLNFCLLSF